MPHRSRPVASAVVVVTVVVLAAAVAAGLPGRSGADGASPSVESSVTTAPVERGPLAALVSATGTLTHRARPDGSPWPVVNQAGGTYTWLPEVGDEIACGGVLHRVDEVPVLLLCGTVPAYRDLRPGDIGGDVRQLNANLHDLGYDTAAGVGIDPGDDTFTAATASALDRLRVASGLGSGDTLALRDAAYLPEPVRIAGVSGEPGGPARPGTTVALATSGELEVQVDLAGSRQGEVAEGDPVRIILPGDVIVTGTVDRVGTIASVPAEQNGSGRDTDPSAATIPARITLDDPALVAGLDQAPVRVEITTDGVDDALSVPVAALLGRAGGGYAVEVARSGGRRELVAVTLGLFDAGGGRVEVEATLDGDLTEDDDVVVPAP